MHISSRLAASESHLLVKEAEDIIGVYLYKYVGRNTTKYVNYFASQIIRKTCMNRIHCNFSYNLLSHAESVRTDLL